MSQSFEGCTGEPPKKTEGTRKNQKTSLVPKKGGKKKCSRKDPDAQMEAEMFCCQRDQKKETLEDQKGKKRWSRKKPQGRKSGPERNTRENQRGSQKGRQRKRKGS